MALKTDMQSILEEHSIVPLGLIVLTEQISIGSRHGFALGKTIFLTVAQLEAGQSSLDQFLLERQVNLQDFNVLSLSAWPGLIENLSGSPQLLNMLDAIHLSGPNESDLPGLDAFLTAQEFSVQIYFEDGRYYLKKSTVTISHLGVYKMGRLGNQLIQYAFLRCYALVHDLRYETSLWVGQALFGHPDPPIRRPLPKMKEVLSTYNLSNAIIPNAHSVFRNVDFWGYFQYHTRYYYPYQAFIRSLYQPVPTIASILSAGLARLRERGKTVIGIHVRRGDFVYIQKGRFLAPCQWYLQWLETIWPTLEAPVLFLASDDMEAVLPEFAAYNPVTSADLNVTLPEDSRFEAFYMECYPDFYLLSQCDLLAASHSTFSFVAAMLNTQASVMVRPDFQVQQLVPFDPWDFAIEDFYSKPAS